jgi:hypothetical protein
MKKIIVTIVFAVSMMACSTHQSALTQAQRLKFKELTKDVCEDNLHEVLLAQALYNEMKKK